MKRTLFILLALIIMTSVFAACNSGEKVDSADTNGEKISVVTSIFPQYDFVRQIAGENVELTMLLLPGAESHSFEPTPQDIIKIQNCDMFVYVGGESDDWIDGILDSVDTSNMKTLALMDMVETVEEEIVEGMQDEDEHGHSDDADTEEHDHDAEYDEHVWTSPKNAKTIVSALTDALCELDEGNAATYRDNAAAYLEDLDELDSEFRQVVSDASRKTIVFGDRFPLRYFVDTYGLQYFAAFPGCSSESEASAATVAFLIDKVNDENIPVVFHVELSNEKMADTICEATGANKRLFHICHNITKDEFENGVSYLELMRNNVDALKEALQ